MKWQVQFATEQTQHCILPAQLSEGVPFAVELASGDGRSADKSELESGDGRSADKSELESEHYKEPRSKESCERRELASGKESCERRELASGKESCERRELASGKESCERRELASGKESCKRREQVQCVQRGRHVLLLRDIGDGLCLEEKLTCLAQEVSLLRHGRSKVQVLYTTQAGKVHSCRAVVGLAAVSMPTAQTDSMQASEVESPLTGKVIKVLVVEGAKVQQGETLVIIEAMKMENVVQAEGNGVVAALNIKVGDAVRSGDVLLSLRGE